jgi:hypothetical protein
MEFVMRNALLVLSVTFSFLLTACGGETTDDMGGGMNDSLSLNSIGNKSILSGDPLSIQLTATDPNSSNFTWAADGNQGSGNPFMAGATFDEPNGTFNWTNTSNASGNYSVLFTVMNDMSQSDSETITIEVLDIFSYGEASYNQYCGSCHGSEGIGGNEQIVQCIPEPDLAAGMSRGPMSGIGAGWADYDREFDAILYYLQNVQPQNC